MKKVTLALVVLFMAMAGFAFAQDKNSEEKIMKKLEKIIQLQKETSEDLAKLSEKVDEMAQRLDKIEKQLKQQSTPKMPPHARGGKNDKDESQPDEKSLEHAKELQEEADKKFQDAYKLHEEKKYDDAIQIFKEIYDKFPKENLGFTSAYNVACGYSLLGKKDEALDWLKKSIEAGFKDFEHMENDTDLDNIRDDARYKKLLDKAAEKDEQSEESY